VYVYSYGEDRLRLVTQQFNIHPLSLEKEQVWAGFVKFMIHT